MWKKNKTAWLFEKNGRRWQAVGFDKSKPDQETGLIPHDKTDALCLPEGDFWVLRVNVWYIPRVSVPGRGIVEGEPARSLMTAKKRAVNLAVKEKILFWRSEL